MRSCPWLVPSSDFKHEKPCLCAFLSKPTQTLVGKFNVPQLPNNSRWQSLVLSSRGTTPSNRKAWCNIMDTFDLVRQV